MNQFKYTVNHPSELGQVVSKIKSLIPHHNIFLFEGEMGSGKTTLIKSICQSLGIKDACSPTFSIINTYLSNENNEIYHIDCYRIEDENEIENIGLLEIINQDSISFIEWPKKIHNFLPKKCVNIKIELQDNLRKILIKI
jgi:tRNA threonylcarbamoyladenosine biosynthesis protein TsaE